MLSSSWNKINEKIHSYFIISWSPLSACPSVKGLKARKVLIHTGYVSRCIQYISSCPSYYRIHLHARSFHAPFYTPFHYILHCPCLIFSDLRVNSQKENAATMLFSSGIVPWKWRKSIPNAHTFYLFQFSPNIFPRWLPTIVVGIFLLSSTNQSWSIPR